MRNNASLSPSPKIVAIVFATLLFSGCASVSDQYYWGHYENLIYQMYNEPGKAPPEVQIEKLTRDLQIAKNKNRPIPPGLYAHIGFMHAALGNISSATEAFETEKKLFPESEVLIDGMLTRAKKLAQTPNDKGLQ